MAGTHERLGDSSAPWTTILILFLLAGCYIAVLVLYRLFFSPLTKIPGPFWTRISTIPETNALKAQRRTQWVSDLFAQNPGSVAVRTGPKSVSFNHPGAVKAIYGKHFLTLDRCLSPAE